MRKDLNNLLIKLLHFVDDDLTYIPDSYFSGTTTDHRGEKLQKWNYSKLKDDPELKLNDNSKDNAGLRFLSFIAFQRKGTATLPDIVRNTGIPERSAWRILTHYKEQNLLESHRAKETIISFVHKGAWVTVKDALIKLSSYLNFGYWKYCGYLIKNTGTRAYKDRFKNLDKDVILQYDDSWISCSNYQQANELHRDLMLAGLRRKISVPSGAPQRHPRHS